MIYLILPSLNWLDQQAQHIVVRMISILVFAIFVVILLKRIVYNLFFPKYCEERKWSFIAQNGQYKFLQKSALHIAFMILFFLFSFKFAHNSLLWFIMTILFTVILLIGMMIISSKKYKALPEPRFKPENENRAIKGRRILSILDIMILILWVLSWKHLF